MGWYHSKGAMFAGPWRQGRRGKVGLEGASERAGSRHVRGTCGGCNLGVATSPGFFGLDCSFIESTVDGCTHVCVCSDVARDGMV